MSALSDLADRAEDLAAKCEQIGMFVDPGYPHTSEMFFGHRRQVARIMHAIKRMIGNSPDEVAWVINQIMIENSKNPPSQPVF